MNNLASPSAQVEFAEIFGRLERDFKLTKAAVARSLRVERSYISMLINGQRAPRLRLLEAMRELEQRLIAGQPGRPEDPGGDELNRLYQQLKALEQTDRPKFEVARQVVASLVQTSSPLSAVASKLLKTATASVIKKPE